MVHQSYDTIESALVLSQNQKDYNGTLMKFVMLLLLCILAGVAHVSFVLREMKTPTQPTTVKEFPTNFAYPPPSHSYEFNAKILIVYPEGKHPHQQAMAEAISKGATEANAQVLLLTTATANFSHVLSSDAIILGSPVYNANPHPDVLNWMDNWDVTADLSEKIGAVFVTAGGISAGEEGTMTSLMRALMVFNVIFVGGEDYRSPFGASAVVDEDPFLSRDEGSAYFPAACLQDVGELVHPMFLERARALGTRVSRVAMRMNSERSCG